MRASPSGRRVSPTRALSVSLCLLLLVCARPAAAASDLRAQLEQVARRIARAQSARAQTDLRIRLTRADAGRARAALARARGALGAMAWTLYVTGGVTAGPVTSDDLQAATDRLDYAAFMASRDRGVLEQVAVREKELGRVERALDLLRAAQTANLNGLRREQRRLDALFDAERARLASIASASRVARRFSFVSGPGPFRLCPVDRPRAYANDFGDPRGDHYHQGIDILAPRGTPIRAPFDGRVAAKHNSLGGLSVKVFGARGYVYNAHLDSYARTGGFARAGAVIGYVGNSGNAAGGPTHDHFEWHPGNGGAVNPYRYLNQVC